MSKVHEIITDQIIAQIEKDPGKWIKGWTGRNNKNIISKKPYHGINSLLLSMSSYTNDYKSPYWLTVKQALKLGGRIKYSEWYKSTLVVFYADKTRSTAKIDPITGEELPLEYRLLRFYKIYNLEQTEGVKAPVTEEFIHDPIETAEKIIEGYKNKPSIKYGTSEACYIPSSDRIEVPSKEQYKNVEEYYSVLFHELTHSTGHSNRLNRESLTVKAGFGSETYSKEELVAELGASFLCNEAGIKTEHTFKNSVAYLAGWLKRLKEDKKLIFNASSLAQKSTNYIMNINN